MKAIHSFGPKDVRIVEVPDPRPTDGQVLLRITASGICGSDKWLWRSPEPVTRIAGHEIAGQVIGLGPGVRHLRLGDRVAVNNVVGCGRCPACRAGNFVRCPNWTGGQDVNGGFAELVAAPERNCLPLPDELDDESGCLIFDNFGTPFCALERGNAQPGDDLLITGLGPIGLAAVLLAKRRGVYVIAADPLAYRREWALRLGADAVLEPGDHLAAQVRELSDGLGVRLALECSGKGAVYPQAIDSLRIGGTLVPVGEGARFELEPSPNLIRRQLSLAGSWYSGMTQGRQVMELFCSGVIQPKTLVTHRGSLVEFPDVFAAVCEFDESAVKAVIFP